MGSPHGRQIDGADGVDVSCADFCSPLMCVRDKVLPKLAPVPPPRAFPATSRTARRLFQGTVHVPLDVVADPA